MSLKKSNEIIRDVVRKFNDNSAFRQELLANPRKAVESAAGHQLKPTVTVSVSGGASPTLKIKTGKSNEVTIALSASSKVSIKQLSDVDLDRISGIGGMASMEQVCWANITK